MSTKRKSVKPGFVVRLTCWLIVLGAIQPISLWSQSGEQSQADITSLIENLESDNYQIRESAERDLVHIGVPAARLLAEKVIVGNPESAMRSARILQDIGARANVESDMLRLACAMDYLANNGFPHFQNSAVTIASRWKSEQAEKIRDQIRECGIDFPDALADDPFGQGGMRVIRGNVIIQNGMVVRGGVIVRGGGELAIIDDGFVTDEVPTSEATELRPSVRPDNERLRQEIDQIFEADETAITQRMKQAVMQQDSVAANSPGDPFAHSPNLEVFGNSGFNQPSATIDEITEKTHQGLELMRLLPAVPQVVFNECEIPDDVVDQLSKVPGLQVISLNRCKYEPANVLKLLETNPYLTIDATGHEAFLGVSVQPGYMETDQGDNIQVCEVQTVVEESAAAEAGIQVGDQILEIDGLRVLEFNHLIVCIASHRVGDEVTLKFVSGGDEREVTVTLRKRPELE
jgi:PDZ domain